MTSEVTWVATIDGGCAVVVKLTGEAYVAIKRDFLTAMDEALQEAEDIFCREYERRTGKKL